MTDKRIIAVVGATGKQGGGLVRAILDDPAGRFAVRAITRRPDSDAAKALADRGAEGRDRGSRRRGEPDEGAAGRVRRLAEYEDVFAGVRDPAEVRKLNPRLQDFATWLADNRDKFRG
jgi:uncharacterized protein YbjT (DUF2867 family)